MSGIIWTKEEEIRLTELVLSAKYSYKEISKIMGRSYYSCKDHSTQVLRLRNNYIYTIYSQDENFWENPNSINCYWAGMSAADCHIRERQNNKFSYILGLANSDVTHIEQFKKHCLSDGKIYINNGYKKNKKTGRMVPQSTANICINSTKWAKDLAINFNIVPNKTHRLAPPNLNDKYLEFCYLIGMTDGDGTICFGQKSSIRNKNKKIYTYPVLQIRYCSCSYSIIAYIKDLIDSVFDDKYQIKSGRGMSKIHTDTETGKNPVYSYNVTGMRALCLFNFLKDFPVPKMDRKWKQSKLLEYLDQQKQKYPHLFVSPNLDKAPDLSLITDAADNKTKPLIFLENPAVLV